jgi:hypothetical protein
VWDRPSTTMKPLTLALVCIALASCGSPLAERREANRQTEAGTTAPSEITMTCDGKATSLDSNEVQAQADGVHVTIVNTSGEDLGYTVSLRSGGGFGENAPRKRGSVVLSLPPGELLIGCPDPESEEDPTAGLPILEVFDPERYYVPRELECTSKTATGSDSDYGVGARGDTRNPVAIVEERFKDEVAPGDEVVRAGYPEEKGDPTVVIRRDGRTVVSVHFFGNDEEGYLADSEDICGDFRR